MLDKLKRQYRKVMAHRYGWDGLNTALYALGLVLFVLSYIFKRPVMANISMILLVIALFRAFSKNWGKRRKEYQRFNDGIKPIKMQWVRFKNRKHYRYIHCPSCNQLSKVPRGVIELRRTLNHCFSETCTS